MVDLDQFQAQAARSPEARLLISAPAGSGKTRVMIERAQWLFRTQNVGQESLLMLTFAKQAARELRERLDGSGMRHVQAATFHAWAYRLMRSLYTVPFHLILEHEKNLLLKRELIGLLREPRWSQHIRATAQGQNWSLTFLAQELLYAIDTLRQFGWSRDRAVAILKTEPVAWPWAPVLIELWRRYEQLLERHGAFDFPLLIERAILFLQNDAARLRRIRKKLAHVLVDEVQDANTSEFALLNLLIGHQSACTFVGDRNQAVYGWRGSRPLAWSGSEVTLRNNYRSDANIIALVNNFMRAQKMPAAQLIHATRPVCAQPFLIEHVRYQEKKVIGRLMIELKEKGYAAHDVLVLARCNSPLREFTELKRAFKGLRCSTVHAVKGREARVVIIINCSDDRFGFPLPQREYEQPLLQKLVTYDQLAEERRLFYVALTRARDLLIVLTTEGRRSNFVMGLNPVKRNYVTLGIRPTYF